MQPPFAAVPVSRPSTFVSIMERPASGSPTRGSLFVCLFVRLLGRGHPVGLFALRSIEWPDRGRPPEEVMEEGALISGLSSSSSSSSWVKPSRAFRPTLR